LSLDAYLQQRLAERQQLNRYRRRHLVQSPAGPAIVVDGRSLISFCSNDYLGLANHPKVIEALQHTAGRYGVGSGASHLVSGHSTEHHQLEEELAEFTGRDRALLFSTGYMANMGAINALLNRHDAIFQDKLNHASLIDAGLLSGAQFQRFRHNDLEHLQHQLNASTAAHRLIAVDGVFSMDGDCAPLTQLATVAEQNNAWLMVDDAHGFGCLGANGGGCAELFGLSQQQLPILMGTLGKAFGTFGAFVAGSEALIEALIQFSRTYIYTTALPPSVAAATRASLQLLRTEHHRREHLQRLIARFKEGAIALGLNLSPSMSAIQPLLIGDDARALRWSQALAERGLWVSAIRPPTVPEGSARLRITFSAEHSLAQVDSLVQALADCVAAKL
jgi:8-amino-7-oxononanoate synthase